MKSLIIFAVMTSAVLTSACGSDQKKKADPKHVFHNDTGRGLCLEVVQEDLAAKGFMLPSDTTAGACPQLSTVLGKSVSRYAACPFTTDQGAPATAVFYSQIVNDDGEVSDMTLLNPQRLCQEFVKNM